ncbi:hypothetical protein ATANTOWER_015083 [Ataeniobius toweri]|uniref:Uncharacterized protein n=1 Tax=Ataeniobius toweri TaxID=208326 RepID=A0ABU7B7M5_9TELE|nr:hypothetical protein [Ataeniobius toweri]
MGMSDYESDDPAGSSQDLFPGPHPPVATYARRSSRLASQVTPSPSSQLRASGINPGSDQDPSQLAEILSHDSSPPPSMGKRRCKTSNPPAKKRRGCSSSTLASAMSLPSRLQPHSSLSRILLLPHPLQLHLSPLHLSHQWTYFNVPSHCSLITSWISPQNMPRQLSIRTLPHPTLSLSLSTSPQLSH